jgi:hypothetical protein
MAESSDSLSVTVMPNGRHRLRQTSAFAAGRACEAGELQIEPALKRFTRHDELD